MTARLGRPTVASALLAASICSCLPACRAAETNEASSAGASGDADQQVAADYAPRALTVVVDPTRFDPNAAQPLGDARQGDAAARYFLAVYGYQAAGPLNLPRFTHSWALFIEVDGARLESAPLQTFVISWDAGDGDIGLEQPVEPGHNYTLPETFALADRSHAQVRRSRITEVSAPLFDRAVREFRALEAGERSGLVRYEMADDETGRAHVQQGLPGYLNCQHALTDIMAGPGGTDLENTGVLRGWAASDNAFTLLTEGDNGLHHGLGFDAVLGLRLGI